MIQDNKQQPKPMPNDASLLDQAPRAPVITSADVIRHYSLTVGPLRIEDPVLFEFPRSTESS